MNTEKEKEKETMEVEKITLERLLLMAGRDAEAEIKKLLDMKWWNWPEEELRRRGNEFAAVDSLLGEKTE